jgi:ADP-L-glycero-D-manno-heptose 6-epimerase
MAGRLNNKGRADLVLIDDFSRPQKEDNYSGKSFRMLVNRDHFIAWLDQNHTDIECVIHLGARTDTTEFDVSVFDRLNLGYSKEVWKACSRHGIPLIYASSAATYGDGALGYDDADPTLSGRLLPLNPYGISKNEFDKWALEQTETPPRWYGLKFFNVFGPNEYHKGRMASVIFHAFNQIRERGTVRLFRSHRPDFTDGGQLRDFIYVKDVTAVIYFLLTHSSPCGIYNLGTGVARSFLDLAHGVFAALGKSPSIEFIDTPADIRDKYQYFTEAKMEKLRNTGYTNDFTSLEQGITEYVQAYLAEDRYL